ncbi:MAG: hypothetical protein H6739_15460 [Alphaproteobacteria bacterium]|nr:hypothetical protein [Alphaproteobacteria bacterium]
MVLPLLAALSLPAHAAECGGLEPWLVALDADEGCTTLTLGALREQAAMQDQQACLALALGQRGLPVPERALAHSPARPPMPEKATRDPYGLFRAVESENFVVRWEDGITNQAAEEILVAFEEAWAFQIIEQGYPEPRYADEYKINVYVGESGPNAPQLYNSPAYQSVDIESVPMIVMADYLIDYTSGKNTAAHEFHHMVQDAISTYSYTGSGAWYWEATASWIEVEVYPNDMSYASSLYGYAYIPHRSVDYFKLASSTEWELENYHQYGALIWPRYLTEFHVDATFIRDTWLEGDFRNDPMLTTRELLEEREGLDSYALFFDFAARNAVWDYQDRDAFLDVLASRQDDYQDQSITRVIQGGLTDWANATQGTLPERYGVNYVKLTDLEGDDLHVMFEGEAEGDSGSPAQWNVTVVYPRGAHGAYREVPLNEDGLTADVWLEGVADDSPDEVWLVIAVVSDVREPREVFNYRYFVETDFVEEEEEDTDPPPITDLGHADTGRCAQAPAGPMWMGLLAGLALLVRRRR